MTTVLALAGIWLTGIGFAWALVAASKLGDQRVVRVPVTDRPYRARTGRL